MTSAPALNLEEVGEQAICRSQMLLNYQTNETIQKQEKYLYISLEKNIQHTFSHREPVGLVQLTVLLSLPCLTSLPSNTSIFALHVQIHWAVP